MPVHPFLTFMKTLADHTRANYECRWALHPSWSPTSLESTSTRWEYLGLHATDGGTSLSVGTSFIKSSYSSPSAPSHMMPLDLPTHISRHLDSDLAMLAERALVAPGVYLSSSAKEIMMRTLVYLLLQYLMTSSIAHQCGGDKVPIMNIFYIWGHFSPMVFLHLHFLMVVYLARDTKGKKATSLLYGRHFITHLALSYRVLFANVIRGIVSYDPRPKDALFFEVMHMVQRSAIPSVGHEVLPEEPAAAADAPI
ncbi:hypothetical protein L2E82_08927 [Cichorium intybus]|uniref:Uncharacterized protein n=1 Tax=Cichorium intybus TaxID=13427 RepID=A0ACB9G937_CICIN|nr:hypothetical protein L2E82_08927 [Cichorium intybus]